MAQDVELQTFVIAGVPELGDEGLVKGTVFRYQQQKDFAAVGEVGRDGGTGLGAHGFDIQTDELAAAAITGFFEHADLVETDAEVGAAEVFILIVFQPILIVQVDAAQFVVGQGEGHFIARVESCQQGVRAFDQAFDALWIAGGISQGDGVADGWNVGLIGRLIGFRLDPDFNFGIIRQHPIDRFRASLASRM